MRKKIQTFIKKFIYSKENKKKTTFTGSGHKGRGRVQTSTTRFNKPRK